MSEELVIVSVEDRIGRLSFNRPKSLNAFSHGLMEQATAALKRLTDDPAVLAIVVSGEGRAFSAGFDLKEGDSQVRETLDDWKRVLDYDFDFIVQFWDCPKPTVAAVQGYCLAGAFEVMLACDMTVASEGARFGEPEVRFGSGIVCMLLPWLTTPKLAKEILLTGADRITAQRMYEMGMVNRVVPEGQHIEGALALARDLAAAAPQSVKLTKRAINRSYEAMGLRAALAQALDAELMIESSAGPERKEFNRIRAEQGLKAAIAWRDARFK
jgi:enoyl-CoA hydratase